MDKQTFLTFVDAVMKHHKGSIEGMTIKTYSEEEVE